MYKKNTIFKSNLLLVDAFFVANFFIAMIITIALVNCSEKTSLAFNHTLYIAKPPQQTNNEQPVSHCLAERDLLYNDLGRDVGNLIYRHLYDFELFTNIISLGLTCKYEYKRLQDMQIRVQGAFLDLILKKLSLEDQEYYFKLFHTLIPPTFFYNLLNEIAIIEKKTTK